MQVHHLHALLERMAQARVLLVGDAMLDRYIYGQTDRVSREAPVPVVLYESEENRLGGAGNAARNIRALGGHVDLVALQGLDANGAALLDALRAEDVGVNGVVQEPGRVTLTKLRVLAGAQGTARQQVLRLDHEHRQDTPENVVDELCAALRRRVESCDVVLVSDYGGGTVDARLRQELASVAARKLVIVDSRHRLAAFSGPFFLKPNAPELATSTGLPCDDLEQVQQAARLLRERCGARAVLATRGRQGMVLIGSDKAEYSCDVFGGGDVTDVTGAGDTVAATVALALAAGASEFDAMTLATIAAGLVVQERGAATVSPDQLEQACADIESSQ